MSGNAEAIESNFFLDFLAYFGLQGQIHILLCMLLEPVASFPPFVFLQQYITLHLLSQCQMNIFIVFYAVVFLITTRNAINSNHVILIHCQNK